jgi:hypothetical protein
MGDYMILRLYHASKDIITNIDLSIGRENADFVQGFYLSDNIDFSYKWAKKNFYINIYELDTTDLKIKHFSKDNDWFEYIKNNRNFNDTFKDFDLIIGPISPDTIYNTYGIMTSGLIESNKALKILLNGKNYIQYALKSKKCLSQLKYIESFIVDYNKLKTLKNDVKKEEKEFQNYLLKILA